MDGRERESDAAIVDLAAGRPLGQADLGRLIAYLGSPDGAAPRERLFERARETALARFGGRIYVRGLIEFTNICRRDCLYCGIRRSNARAARYRLSPDAILACCERGYGLGFRTFVLQGGEDPWFTDDVLVNLISAVKAAWPDCALTLSVGERSGGGYRRFRAAGADRFLLRHETADPDALRAACIRQTRPGRSVDAACRISERRVTKWARASWWGCPGRRRNTWPPI